MTQGHRLIVGLGYLGDRVAKRWRKSASTVFATTRNRERFPELQQAGLVPVCFDVTQATGNDALPAADIVMFCVGFDRSIGKSIGEVYVDGLARTLELMHIPRLFIYASSTGVFGDAEGAWIDENSPTGPIDDAGRACLEAEELLLAHALKNRYRPVILRFAGIYGPGRMIGAQGLRENRPIPANPNAYLNLIHVEDGADVVDAVTRSASPSTLYLVSDGNPVKRLVFYKHLASRINAPAPKFDAASAQRFRGDRRVSSAKMLRELHVKLHFPDYRAGILDIVRHDSLGAR